jgi:mono/diheme cytochrome c family protein
MPGPFLIAVLIGFAGFLSLRATAAEAPLFETQVRPILKAHCFHCHGEGEELKGKVDLRLRRLMAETRTDDGVVIVPGDANASLMVKLIRSGEMPKGEKKLTPEQIRAIEAWIDSDAATAGEEPHQLPKGFHITEAERKFWAFQPIQSPTVPKWSREDGVRTSIDVFILEKLRREGLAYAKEADKIALIRRACFDLLGLPPTPEQIDEFLADNSPDAYERLLDRLLESQQYGERWARHWLDVAGYADSNGYAEADSVRPHAWRYRDYVIRAFNSDKPWNDFIVEQLAGDELAGVTHENAAAKALDSKVQELLTATGFLRMAPDGTADEVPDQKLARNQVVAETIKIVSSSLLGLTVGCAQCHDHRYEPISHVDYHRMRALFEPALDPKNWRNPAQRLVSLYAAEDRKKADEIEAEARKIDEGANQLRKELLEKVFEKELAKLPEDIREAVKEARNTPRDKRSPEQIALLKVHPSADVQGALDLYDPEANKKVLAKQEEASKLRATKPPEPFVPALTEPAGKVADTFLFHRGDHDQPKEKVEPAEMEILQTAAQGVNFTNKAEGLSSSGRRLAYARWLASGRHPLVARVLVNRFWLHHFGRGLVNTPGDFGLQGERPTHPELLDWLATEFMKTGWKLKPLHKLIMTSTVYRQSSENSKAAQLDPENRLYARMKLRRFDAETLRDTILAVSGKMTRDQFGPPVPIARDEVGRVVTGNQKNNGNNDPVLVDAIGDRAFRRSVYVQVRRSLPLTVLDAFDAPVMSPNCEARNVSTATPQSLTMLNDNFVAEHAEHFARRLQSEYPGDATLQVKRAWRLAFGTRPSDGDVSRALIYLAEQGEQIRAKISGAASNKKSTASSDPQLLAFASYCHALLSANRFMYVD